MSHDNVKIVRFPKTKWFELWDNGGIVHCGERPVDINFCQRVYDTLLSQDYEPVVNGLETTFRAKS